MKLLSIDPGYERLGVAVLEKNLNQKETLLFSGCIRTSPKDTFEDRLLQIGVEVEKIIQEYQPQALSIENLFISTNQKTAMRVAEVRGVLIYIAKKYNLTIKEFTPLQIKLAVTVDRKSSKDQVIKMIHLLIKNFTKKALDDEYDAIAAGLTYFAHVRL